MRNILFLAHRVPWPPNRGDKIRSYHILKHLTHHAQVHLGCFADDQAEETKSDDIQARLQSQRIICRTKPQWIAGLQALASGQPVSITAFRHSDMKAWVDNTISKYSIDSIFIFSGQMAQYIPDDFDGQVVMDFVDVDSAKFETYGQDIRGPMSLINRREGRLLARFEKAIGDKADHNIFVSKAEAELFQRRSNLPIDKIHAVGNGIDLQFYDPGQKYEKLERSETGLIIFTGQMDYRPNVEAVDYFARKIMPDILARFPGTTFAIVGRNPSSDVLRLDGSPGCQVTGEVADVRSWLQAADIVVAPLLMARGIQNKVLEAMAMAKPVVASGPAAEGIDAVSGKHYIVSSGKVAFIESISELLKDRQKADLLGKAAREYIISNYGWRSQLDALSQLMDLSDDMGLEAAE